MPFLDESALISQKFPNFLLLLVNNVRFSSLYSNLELLRLFAFVESYIHIWLLGKMIFSYRLVFQRSMSQQDFVHLFSTPAFSRIVLALAVLNHNIIRGSTRVSLLWVFASKFLMHGPSWTSAILVILVAAYIGKMLQKIEDFKFILGSSSGLVTFSSSIIALNTFSLVYVE